MRRVFFILLLIITVSFVIPSYAKEVSFTQEDRDRLIRLETKVDEGLKAVNQRIDATNQRIDTLNTFMLWGFGILFGGMGILIGFVIWDRRTALAPAIKRNKELEERGDKIERALRRYAREDPKLAEILKEEGLLRQ